MNENANFFQRFLETVQDRNFLYGMAVGAAIIVLLVIVKWCICACAKRGKSITIYEENGSFQLSIEAVRSFISRIILAFPSLSLTKVKMRQKADKIKLDLFLNASSDADLSLFRQQLRAVIIQEADDKLGMAGRIGDINFIITSLSPSNNVPKIPDISSEPASSNQE